MQQYARVVLASLALATGCGRIGFDGFGSTHDASDGAAAAIDGDSGATVYGDLLDPTAWTTFDATTLNPGASGFTGAVFDGRYVYLVPSYNGGFNGLVVRHDTLGVLDDAGAWSTFDTSNVNAEARGYSGGAFDGRYVYFVPHETANGFAGVIARYDSQQSFTTPGAWSTFDIEALDVNATGFYGARFDGRYLYLMPYTRTTMARYDTQGGFTVAASWTTLDLSTVATNVPAFVGGAFDGRYLYFVPFTSAAASGRVVRYDTQDTLSSTAAWTTFDTSTIDTNAKGFCGAAFDGRYLYLVPFLSSRVMRFDTQATFTSAAAWSAFDATTVDPQAKGFFGATFDGRYLYFAPYQFGKVARYDTTAGFATASAWALFDTTSVNPMAKAFYGAAFDGGAVYFVPHGAGTVARFAAKSPPSMPAVPGFDGSFL